MSDRSLDLDIGLKIVCIESSDEDNLEIGSGFVFYQDLELTYILTCAHVVRAVGGDSKVLVDGYKAVVIAQSSQKSADDLAVLAIKNLNTYPIQPLASLVPFIDSPILDVHFRTKGYYYQGKNDIVTKFLKGTLNGLVNRRVRYQRDSTQVWELELDDDYLLESGHSGSPIVNKVYHVVCGVVSDKKGDGKKGFGISIETLENVWQESANFLRHDIYDLDRIVKLLHSIFHNNESQFLDFCDRYFSEYYDANLAILPRISYLVLCCHHFDKISDLLDKTKDINKQKYGRYISSVYVSRIMTKSVAFSHKKINICTLLRAKFFSKEIKSEVDCEAEIIYDYRGDLGLDKRDFKQIQLLIIDSFATATTAVLKLSRSQIQILDAGTGSIKIRLKLPYDSLKELINIFH